MTDRLAGAKRHMTDPVRSHSGTSFVDKGEGEPLVLLLDKGEATTGLIFAFSSTHRVIAPDLPKDAGFQDVRRLLDDLGISAANLIGLGKAAGMSLELAAAKPQRVKRVAVVPDDCTIALPAPGILCPALFLTDENRRPVAEALAKSAMRGRVAILPEDEAALVGLLKAFLAERLSPFEPRELRTAFGSFMTGVTIVTTIGADGTPRGFTANSFTSVSIEPPLLLICVGKAAASMAVFREARGFAVNILSEHQKDTSVLFSSKRPDKFGQTEWRSGPFGNPLIDGAAAWFDCARYQVIDAGDHMILMGHIEAFSYSDANPLGYARGGYITLGLEQAAVNAASSASRTVVGAILENEGRLVLLPSGTSGGLTLPEAGRNGHNGSASLLHSLLVREGIDATLGFLFAVFENPQTREQCIYYRGEALLHARGRTVLADFDNLPWDRLADDATRSMLRRYSEERKIGRFKVYSGDHRQGTVKSVD
jgi:flavin reductase (DIM6/NTAB) family NADH-FMN oxidoreductase RutF